MQVNQTAKYAFRAMAVLAGLEPGEAIPAADLSVRTGIPVHYLSKIMRRMVVGKMANSRKGHGGGFSLAKPARDIRFIDVLEACDADVTPNQCAFGWGTCDPDDYCPLHPVWSRLNDSFHDWAVTATLDEVGPKTPETEGRRSSDTEIEEDPSI